MLSFDESGITVPTDRQIAASIVARMEADPLLAPLVADDDALAALIAIWSAELERLAEGVGLLPAVLVYSQSEGEALRVLSRGLFNLQPRQESRSTYPVGVTSTGGSVPLPAGTRINGGGETGFAAWQVVETVTVTASRTTVTIEAMESGPIALDPLGVTLRLGDTVAGIDAIEHLQATDGAGQIGRAAAGTGEIRALIRDILAQPARAQLYAALRLLPWVTAVSIATPSAGTIETQIAPAPVGAAQADALAQAILTNVAPGTVLQGSTGTGSATEPSGEIVSVPYTVVDTETQDVTITCTIPASAGVDATERRDGLEAAARAVFGRLSRDETLRYGNLYSEAWGVVADVATAFAVTAPSGDVTPSAAHLLVPGTITITVTVS